MQAVMRHSLIYLFSGTNTLKPSESNLSTVSTLVTTLNIYNTKTMTWLFFNFSNTPTPREGYTANLLKNGHIVYIGGTEIPNGASRETNINMNNIPVFDTDDLIWIFMTTSGDTVASRNSHSAVLTEDGKIIIFGGESGYGFVKVSPDLAILDTNSIPYEWSIPKNIPPENKPPSLAAHSSTLYNNNYMLIIFGRRTSDQPVTGTEVPLINDIIYVFDIKNLVWTSTISSTPASGQCTTNCVIGLVTAIISLLIISSIGIGCYCYKVKSIKNFSFLCICRNTNSANTVKDPDNKPFVNSNDPLS
ncbi:16174_t:CDS:2 [Gigaspora margarita]|uniref:16174_t:CDS:1 n=1 Tax=Gigaspora margarita TaxID=4874 RepID=A0ABN7VKX3_GIGMA|nr:16174_t:CDS:2 [Gigaspora margarita]